MSLEKDGQSFELQMQGMRVRLDEADQAREELETRLTNADTALASLQTSSQETERWVFC